MSDPADGDATLFEAVITPHRSLDERGLARLVAALIGFSLLVSAGLWLAGAWPVIGFTGLEAALAIWLIRRHAMRSGDSEVLVLSDSGLRVIRSVGGRRSERFLPASWLRATLHESPGRTPALLVRSRGLPPVEIAQFLGEEEKRQLAAALSEAVRRQQSPVFDNEQLRAINPPSDPST